MDESKMTATAADLERALVESLADAAMPSLAAAGTHHGDGDGDAATTATEEDAGDATALAYQDGDLPEFSDGEQERDAAGGAPRQGLVPAKSAKGPGGRRKVPLAAIKARMTGGSAAKKAPAGSSAAAAATAAPPPTAAAALSAAHSHDKGKGKGKSKELKLSDSQLDAVAQRIAQEHPELPKLSPEQVQELVASMQIDKDVILGKKGLMGKGTKDMASHKFWKTQPVVKLDQRDEVKEGVIEADKKPEEIRQDPVDLHKDFRWVTVNLSDPNELKEVYELLTHHYVEDLDATFRFDYSPEFIEWALKPPGYYADWHVGIRVAETGKLVAFIAGIPIELRVRNATKRCTEINFLVVHKKLRSKRFAPILIQEVTRRTHLRGIFQAIYTAGVFLPTPVSRCQYYHRNLNPPKLVKLGFSAVPRNSTVARMATYYRVPTETSIPGLRELEKRDLKQASRLLRAYMARFDMAPLLSNKDIEHALWTGRGKDVNGKRENQVTWAYVVEDPVTHRITDVFSFYALPSTALKSQPLTNVNAAYLYYYATTAAPSCADLGDGSVAVPAKNWKDETASERAALGERLKLLMADALVVVAKNGFDVLNSLTIQDNSLFLEDLKFGKGDGFLHYYLYNYATKPIAGGIDANEGGSGIGVVMLCILKIASLFLRTLSKPIATKIKQQAKEHDGFKTRTIQMAQWLHRAEMNLRVKLLGESPRHVRPLSETKAIESGANFLSEGFLFSVAATIILGETWRARRAENKRRDGVKESLEQHEAQIQELEVRIARDRQREEEFARRERELEKVVEEIVSIGLRGGFGELSDEWKRHLDMGELASRFRQTGRVLKEDDDDDNNNDHNHNDKEPSSTAQEASIQPLPVDAREAVDRFRQAVSSAGQAVSSAENRSQPTPPVTAAAPTTAAHSASRAP
ncbi:hypothetical protein JCM3774_000997 [Rhodotorula dairenensis]